MKIITIYSIFTIALMISACGPNAEQVAADYATKDSLESALKADMIQQLEREQAVQDSTKTAKEEMALAKSEMETALSEAKIELQLANDELTNIKEFHLGRTSVEKENQLRNQYTKIQTLEQDIQEMEKELK